MQNKRYSMTSKLTSIHPECRLIIINLAIFRNSFIIACFFFSKILKLYIYETVSRNLKM